MTKADLGMSQGPKYVDVAASIAASEIWCRYRAVTSYELKPSYPKIMLMLGSGCGDVAKSIDKQFEIPYEDVSGMSQTTVRGHVGKLVIGTLHGKSVIGFQCRNHVYEGNSSHQASLPVYVAKHLGAKAAIFTCAVGVAPNTDQVTYPANPGDIVLVTSYFPNQMPSSLTGKIRKDIGPRFPGTMNVPSIYLTMLARDVGLASQIELKEGVLVPKIGPSYETPVEVQRLTEMADGARRMILGGMSTIPELEAANMLGIPTLVYGVITNQMFNMVHREEIVGRAREGLGNLLDANGTSRHTLEEAERVVRGIVTGYQPSHAEVAQVAGSDRVTQNLEKLIGGVVRAIRF